MPVSTTAVGLEALESSLNSGNIYAHILMLTQVKKPFKPFTEYI